MLQPCHTSAAAAFIGPPGGAAKYGSLFRFFSHTVASGPYDGYPGARGPGFALTASEVVAHFTKSMAAARFFVCLETTHGPPPTWPVVGGSLPQRSGIAAVISPAGIFSVPPKMSFAYQVGPGMSSTLSSDPPYAFAKSGEKMVVVATDLFAISGSSRVAMRVQ